MQIVECALHWYKAGMIIIADVNLWHWKVSILIHLQCDSNVDITSALKVIMTVSNTEYNPISKEL